MVGNGLVQCFIALGSNLDDPVAHVCRAFYELAELPQSRLLQRSSLYRSAPMGPQDQPDYINAVAELETRLPALDLLHQLQYIEKAHQRVRERHWGPRTLDLDILLYGELKQQNEELCLPHPGLLSRNFVLYPLAEIAAELVLDGVPITERLATCPMTGLEPLETDCDE